MPTSPTQRTLAYLRKRGEIPAVVEKWNSHGRVRQDLYGFIDILTIRHRAVLVAIQCTSGSSVSARVKKILENENAVPWLLCCGKIEVWGWRKAGPRGKRKTWKPRVVMITLRRDEAGRITEEMSCVDLQDNEL